jgi:microtubule-binding protein TANGLED1
MEGSACPALPCPRPTLRMPPRIAAMTGALSTPCSPTEFGLRSLAHACDFVSYSESCWRRMRGGASAQKRSPSGKFGGIVGGEGAQWRRMSLPAMLLDETVQVSQFARGIVTTAGAMNREPPRTPKPAPRTRKPAAGEPTPLHARRAREKQSHRGGTTTRGAGTATPPSRSRVRSRIQFKPVSSVAVSRPSVSANRVSPKNRPWAKKAVMFQNPMFHASTSAAIDPCATSSPSKKQKRLYKTRSPVVAQQIPHKFLVKVATERARIQSQDAREGPARETRRRS